MRNKEVGARLKSLRMSSNLEQQEVAKLMGYKSDTTISKWENGKNLPNGGKLAKLASIFNTSTDYILHGESIKPSNIHPVTPTERIPVLGQIACGEPIDAEENIAEYRSVAKDRLPSGKAFYLQAKGNSMEPKIPDKSYVLCREQPDVENGEIAAVLVNGDEEATLKKVIKQGNTVLLQAINEDYAPYIINEDNPARIVGKAIHVETDL